jgi:hypothetical protein
VLCKPISVYDGTVDCRSTQRTRALPAHPSGREAAGLAATVARWHLLPPHASSCEHTRCICDMRHGFLSACNERPMLQGTYSTPAVQPLTYRPPVEVRMFIYEGGRWHCRPVPISKRNTACGCSTQLCGRSAQQRHASDVARPGLRRAAGAGSGAGGCRDAAGAAVAPPSLRCRRVGSVLMMWVHISGVAADDAVSPTQERLHRTAYSYVPRFIQVARC